MKFTESSREISKKVEDLWRDMKREKSLRREDYQIEVDHDTGSDLIAEATHPLLTGVHKGSPPDGPMHFRGFLVLISREYDGLSIKPKQSK